MALQILSVHHVQLTVSATSEAATIAFYRDVIGLPEIAKPEALRKNGGAWFRHGTTEIHISREAGEVNNWNSKRHLCFEVADLERTQVLLRVAGIVIIPDEQPVDDWLRCYVRDPGGNRLEFAQLVA